jgi:glycosyltransferase involved in cell wall biosynthesis
LLPGFPRGEKGFDVLVAAVPKLAPILEAGLLRLKVHTVAIGNGSKDIEESVSRLDAESRRIPGIELKCCPLSIEEYERDIEECDILILPYRLSAYKNRSSGIAVEGLMLGRPLLVTRGLALLQEVEPNGAVIQFSDGDADDLADALAGFVRNPDGARSAAEAYARTIMSQHSPAKFVSDLQSLARRHVGKDAPSLSP